MVEEQDAQAEARDRRREAWYIAAFVILVLIILWLLWNYWGGDRVQVVDDGTAATATAIVPDVVGMTRSDAVAVIDEAGFDADVETVFDPEAEPDVVVEQRPRAGAETVLGSTVTIGVASSFGLDGGLRDDTENPYVPDVVGDHVDDAVDAIESAGFVVAVRYRDFEPFRKDHVYAQAPDGGSRAALGSRVIVSVSTGPQIPRNVTVPNTLGMTEAQAVRSISSAGLDPQVLRRPQPSSLGRVYSQFPLGGDVLEEGSEVHVIVGTK